METILTDLLSRVGVEFTESGHHHCRPGWVQLKVCPYCGSGNFHLGININAKFAACWKCGGHNLYQLLVELGLPKSAAYGFVKGSEFVSIEKQTRHGLVEPAGRGPLLTAHRRYLHERGFDPDEIQKLWGIQGIGIAAKLAWRIYIPVQVKGKTVSWTARSVSQQTEQRYISAPAECEAVSIKEVLYGLDYVRGAALIVEGPTDVWNIGPGAVGLFGLAYSTAQVRALSLIPRRFVCFDNSKDAQQRARALASDLACFPGTTQIVELDAEDPGSASKEEVDSVRKYAGF